jgi:VIT1/CCC1 family predicted Fe2+/Mn2+ transporter
LPPILGVSDGILNALTLAAGAILRGSGDGLDVTLALRVGAAAFVTAAFTMFVAYYSERRSHLVRAAKQLNILEPRTLAATNLGRAVLIETGVATATAAFASLIGAVVPLLLGILLPTPAWVTLVITVGFLGALGWAIGASLSARRTLWCLAMLLGGTIVTLVGAALDIA